MKLIKFPYRLRKKLVKRNKKVVEYKIEECYSASDKISVSKEVQKFSPISLEISNKTAKNNELNRLKPSFLSEFVRILSELVKTGKPYNHEKFYQILQEKYSDDLREPLDFEKAKEKLVRTGLLTKTISGYFPVQLLAVASIEPYLLDRIPTLIQSGRWDKDLYTNQIFKDMATSLTERERDILFKRYFTKNPQSLKVVGQYYGVSRERIRQVEERALIKLRENGLHVMFLFELIRLGSPSILSVERLTAINRNLKIKSENSLCLIKIMQKIINFNFYLFGNKFIYLQYENYPVISDIDINKWIDKTQIPKEEFKDYLINEGFYFLTENELGILYNYFSEQHHGKAPLKNLIIRSLKLIGCPAHYSDIAEKVREIGEEKYKNYNDNPVHAALNHYDEFVWVGKRGIYGLREWGLSSPDKSLEEQVYSILKNSGKSLSKENIATELSKQRPYFTKTSLDLILSISNKIIKNLNNLYRAVNEKDIEVEKFKKAQMDKISNAMEDVFKEWKE